MLRNSRLVGWVAKEGESLACAIAGSLVFVTGRLFADEETARIVLQILGGAAVLFSPILGRTEGRIHIGKEGIDFTLRQRQLRESVIVSAALAPEENLETILAVAKAPHEALSGILPFINQEVASAVVEVPKGYDGLTLAEGPLNFVRKDLDISVIGLRTPRNSWILGGIVSHTPLVKGMELLVAGNIDSVSRLGQELVDRMRNPALPPTEQ